MSRTVSLVRPRSRKCSQVAALALSVRIRRVRAVSSTLVGLGELSIFSGAGAVGALRLSPFLGTFNVFLSFVDRVNRLRRPRSARRRVGRGARR